MKAIAIPYSCQQNAPSQPLKELVDVPVIRERGQKLLIAKRNKLLKALFIKHVYDDAALKDIRVYEGKADDYGDIIVEHRETETYLFLTFVKA